LLSDFFDDVLQQIFHKVIIKKNVDECLELSQYSTEAARMAQTKLCDIPQVLINCNMTYELRGVIRFRPRKSNLQNSIGNYQAYLKRAEGYNWEL